MPAANNARFLINLAGMQHLSVLGFSGTEALDEVYEIIINIIAPQPLDASLLQQPVCLTLLSQYSDSNTALPADQHPRYINGVVDTLTQTGYQADSGYEYTITVVPQLALLKHRRRYQIFQQQNVPAIVGQLLKEAGITAVKQQLQGSYTARDYCVQYGESDLEFIQRILSEAGIFFYFEHTATDHTLVLQDNMMQSQDLTPLMYHPHTGQVPDGSVVTQWTVTHKVTPGVTSGRTYDFTRPHTKEESFEVTHSDQKNTTMLQQDQGLQPVQDDLTKPNASRRQQEQAERDQIVVKGKTDSIECLPGYYLLLKDHPDASNNTLWLLTKVTHKGMQPQVKEAYASQRESGSYQATFEAVHQHLSWRPSIIKKPQQTGPQTAIVTGPEGQEIFTDNYGRVKVQFHWDRKAQGDDKSSAWLRVMQQWAGAGYGTFSLPRVGHEVLVSFLNHDIDQPVITGSLHNGTNKPAYSLPDNKTRSGIKTLSSPGGNTDNELRFDDKQGQEQIYIHAGKDFAQQIDNDQHIVVNNDHHHTTKNNHYQQVQGEQHTTVNKGSFTTVQGSVNETVQGSVQTKVAKSHLLNAGKTIHVKAGQHVVFNAGKTLTLKAGGKFLTINSNGVSVSSGIKISSGGSSGAADAAPKTAAMPGSVDKAGFGQTPIPESAQTPEVLTALAKGQVLTAAQIKQASEETVQAAALKKQADQAKATEEAEKQAQAQKEKETIRIGVFFDGTGNDAYNTIYRQQCEHPNEETVDTKACEYINAWAKNGTSYSNSYTNIYRLRHAYHEDKSKGIAAVYVEGIGTQAGKADTAFPDEAWGIGAEGIIAKVENAIETIATIIPALPAAANYKTLVLDIFGFSRGAAAARHFANEVYKGIQGKQSAFYEALDITAKETTVKINFIGLFDTVAAVGNIHNWFNVPSASNPGINLYLPNDIAKKVLQLRAMNEYRENFSLNSVVANNSVHQEIGVYGSHSDVGGGYQDTSPEKSNIMAPYIATLSESSLDAAHATIKTAQAMYSLYAKNSGQFYTPPAQRWEEPNTTSSREAIHEGWAQSSITWFRYITTLDRSINTEAHSDSNALHSDLQLLAGHLMHHVASKQYGVPLKAFPKTDDIPEALNKVYKQYQDQITALGQSSGNIQLDKTTEHWLIPRYVHCSANWNPEIKPLPLYVNKPYIQDDQLARHVYPNAPQQGYPFAMKAPEKKESENA